MIYFLSILYIAGILFSTYLMARKEETRTRRGILGYFGFITIGFLISLTLIGVLDVSEDAARRILVFAYLYVIPFMMLIGYKLLGFIKVYKRWQMVILGIVGLFNLMIFGYLLLFIFTILFYYMVQA
ncbi:hypothetical protein [Salinicoccus roseus]|uniref:Uncharacterized protein n=1 Tax=Salinicoccus roseus TaxID=45670 RepID=A0A0C2HEX4_9STAP|nr:hypothetical protein [Salinicoccus roseus]KIH70179.1 hypothetical protein SN16_09455 [Salinicoccus roseus]MDB0581026.1 hypothetical protein [Salinicoccus roseus]